ncbi:MAG: hypothetical protein QOC66_2164 [Pseudonocardiales bacterium]|jgi:hypothetical protein|nr:hypothetical protein [Pseudonocardiales bacterium]
MIVRPVLAIAGVVLLTGCSGSDAGRASSSPPLSTRTATVTQTRAPDIQPIATGPTTAAVAASCPFVGQSFVRDTIGMRLGRITALRSGGRTVGCRFYALQGSSLSASEHLPGPRQPAVEITTSRYASTTAAHNAFVRIAQRGTNLQPVQLGGGVTGVCFQTDFYPKDRGADWACATNQGGIAVLVRTVVTAPALNAKLVTERVLHGL